LSGIKCSPGGCVTARPWEIKEGGNTRFVTKKKRATGKEKSYEKGGRKRAKGTAKKPERRAGFAVELPSKIISDRDPKRRQGIYRRRPGQREKGQRLHEKKDQGGKIGKGGTAMRKKQDLQLGEKKKKTLSDPSKERQNVSRRQGGARTSQKRGEGEWSGVELFHCAGGKGKRVNRRGHDKGGGGSRQRRQMLGGWLRLARRGERLCLTGWNYAARGDRARRLGGVLTGRGAAPDRKPDRGKMPEKKKRRGGGGKPEKGEGPFC